MSLETHHDLQIERASQPPRTSASLARSTGERAVARPRVADYFRLHKESRSALDFRPVIVRRDEKVRIISRIPLFEACSQAELARIATITMQLDVPEGEVLIREGETGELFFVLVKGTAEVRKGRYRVAALGPGTLRAKSLF